MIINFTIIGGDLRNIKLAKMLAHEGNNIFVYGLEKSEELKNVNNIIICRSLLESTKNSEIIIGPIPFSTNGNEINTPFSDNKIEIREFINCINNKILIAGSISTEIYELAKEEHIQVIDIMKREELTVLNTIATAEGTIEIMITNTDRIIHGSRVLILGFGRVAKILAKKLLSLSTFVTCAARKKEDIAWIKTCGYKAININNIEEDLSRFDIIINTVPHLILTEEKLKYIKQETLLIDLASKPGGIEQETAKNMNLRLIWALALPGKVAPVTTAEFIKDTINNILEEIYNKK